jgi:outer membrane protein OmpA-like peptidoglycan-associated protein
MSILMVGPAAAAERTYRVKRVPDTWEVSASEDSVYFDLGSSSIDEAASRIIQRHVDKLRTAPDLRITVIAHTDDLGSASMELATGQERLDAVRKRLEEQKITPGRIRTENHGSESRSDHPCADVECRSKKRRVDFLFYR